jgi:hypothetical protein
VLGQQQQGSQQNRVRFLDQQQQGAPRQQGTPQQLTGPQELLLPEVPQHPPEAQQQLIAQQVPLLLEAPQPQPQQHMTQEVPTAVALASAAAIGPAPAPAPVTSLRRAANWIASTASGVLQAQQPQEPQLKPPPPPPPQLQQQQSEQLPFTFLQPEEQNLQTVPHQWLPQAAQQEARPLSKEEKERRELRKSQFKPNVNHQQGKDNRAEIRERNNAKQRQLKQQQQRRVNVSPSMMPASGDPSSLATVSSSSFATSSGDSGEDILNQMIYGIQGDIVAGQEAMGLEQTDDDDTLVGYDETMG